MTRTQAAIASAVTTVLLVGAAVCGIVYTPTADPFEVVVNGPTSIAVGEVAVFDVSETGADSYAYSVTPPVPCYLFEDGRKLVFASRTGGIQYVFVVAAAKGGQVSIAEHTVTVEGDPGPSPGPASFATRLKQAVAAVNDAGKSQHLTALADNFRTVASMVAAGVLKEPEEIIAATNNMNTDDLGAAKPAWAGVSQVLATELGVMSETGALTTPEQHIKLWREIATILEGAK